MNILKRINKLLQKLASNHKVKIVLAVILILAALMRFYGLNWDESLYLHPDERYNILTAYNIEWPESFSEYLDPEESPLSPFNTTYSAYIYGTLPLFVGKLGADLAGTDIYGEFHHTGRAISAVWDLGTVLVLYFLGKRMFSKRVGLLAAFLYGVATFPIQQSHFFTVDTALTFWLTLSLLVLYDFIQQKGSLILVWSGLLGIVYAAALASKISAGVFVLVIIAAFLLKFSKEIDKQGWLKASIIMIEAGIIMCIFGYIAFRLFQPYFFANSNWLDLTPQPDFWKALQFQREVMAGEIIFPPAWQWIETTPYLFPLKNLSWAWGIHIVVGFVAAICMYLYNIWQNFREKGLSQVFSFKMITFLWVVGTFVYQGGSFVKTIRSFVPITPIVILWVAWLVFELMRRKQAIGKVALVIVSVLSFLWGAAYINIYSEDTTRLAATKWMYQNVPEMAGVINEAWDDPLPQRAPVEVLEKDGITAINFEGKEVNPYADDTYFKADQYYEVIKDGDYIIISSPRARDSVGRLPQHFQFMHKYYAALESGELGYELAATFEVHPNLFGIEIDDTAAEETFWIYDHPTVKIYQQREEISKTTFYEILGLGNIER